MRRVLIVATVGGFVTQFEQNNLDILRELGYEIHYAANFSNTIYEIDYEALKKRNVIIHDLPIEKEVKKLSSHRRNIKELAKLIDELDIYLVHCHTPVGSVIGRMAARKSKRRPYVIYTAHGFHFYKGCPLSNKIFYPVERFLSRYTDCLVTINEEDYKAARKFRKKLKVVKIPGVGVDTDRFVPLETERNEQEFNLITIGEINRNKNHEVVLRALSLIKDRNIRYTIYGKGELTEYLNGLIKNLGLEDRVVIKGYCLKPEDVLPTADAFVFPSIREGLGMAALEAMSCGIPVIALDNRGTREYMRDGVNGFVCKVNTPEAFASAIIRIDDNMYFDRKVVSVEARNTAKKFSVSNTGKIMRSVYEGVKRKR